MGNIALKRILVTPKDSEESLHAFTIKKDDTRLNARGVHIFHFTKEQPVQTLKKWHWSPSHTLGRPMKFLRPRVIIAFRTKRVYIGWDGRIALLLSLKVYIPTRGCRTSLGPADVKEVLCHARYLILLGENDSNLKALEKLQKKLKTIIKSVGVQRVIFHVEDYDLPYKVQDIIKKCFESKTAFFFHMGVQAYTYKVDNMTDFLASFNTRYFELATKIFTYKEKAIAVENVVLDVDTSDIEKVCQYVHDIIQEWRQQKRDIGIYKVMNYRPTDINCLLDKGWVNYLCRCLREQFIYGTVGHSLKIMQLGNDLILQRGEKLFK